MSHSFSIRDQTGFTLVEVLAVLVVAGILGAMMMQVMDSNVERSADPIVMVQREAELEKAMESIIASYKEGVNNPPFDLTTFYQDTVSKEPLLDPASTGYVSFSNGTETFHGMAQVTHCLKVGLVDGDQSLVCLFTD